MILNIPHLKKENTLYYSHNILIKFGRNSGTFFSCQLTQIPQHVGIFLPEKYISPILYPRKIILHVILGELGCSEKKPTV
jgi:hypothetical protein